MKLTLKKIDPVRFALIYATIISIVIFVLLALFLIVGSLITSATGEDLGPLGVFFGGGVIMLIVGPIIYFMIAFLFTLIGGMIFNYVSEKIGGIDLFFDEQTTTIANSDN